MGFNSGFKGLNHCSGVLGRCSCVIRMAFGWNWARFTLLCHGIFLVEIPQLTHLKAEKQL